MRVAARIALAGAALTLVAVGCVVGTPPWVAPSLRGLYRADGPGRAGLRFLVARKENEIAVTLQPADAEPAYERHSGWVYFSSLEGGSYDLARVRLSGDERTPITSTGNVNERWPALSPDGRVLFYTSDYGGTEQIWRSEPDGSNPAAVTRGPEPHSRAAVDSSGMTLVALEGDTSAGRLVRIDVASGSVTPVEGVAEGMVPVGRPAVRADGTIAYACRAPRGTDICELSPGKPARRLTEGEADERDPAWSPEGGAIVFSSNRADNNFELYLMRDDGSKVRRLTNQRGADIEPAFVP
jgi:TolB protein